MIVTISGLPGSGKSTVGQALAKKLHLDYYDIGQIRRAMAKERGLTLEQFNKLGESEAFTDHEVDEYQRGLSKKDGFVLVSRLGYHFVPNSFKIFLVVSTDEAAKRILNDKERGPDERFKTLAQAKEKIEARNASDKKRYKKYYDIDPYDLSHYDLLIDTSSSPPESIVRSIIKVLETTIKRSKSPKP